VKQSPVERGAHIEEYAPLKRKMLRREERPQSTRRNDMISEMAEQLLLFRRNATLSDKLLVG